MEFPSSFLRNSPYLLDFFIALNAGMQNSDKKFAMASEKRLGSPNHGLHQAASIGTRLLLYFVLSAVNYILFLMLISQHGRHDRSSPTDQPAQANLYRGIRYI
ncbi:hypothetical protein WK90_32685 [Burkholderia cepacia]|nr:hypothetical protein WK83_32515 [Burkholderia cepacia]KVV67375.1 hypothetical protein WK85_24200 [Burkholderia cepacia]KVV70645.1 hypothetical protein WK84_13415 [Burkholderia cepacia]KVV77052.1 hypothetical protein WK87_34455 [Burkholderia cepacia]KVV85167.1 hypothetical protein WK86_11465 [Burkholderia cepacia]